MEHNHQVHEVSQIKIYIQNRNTKSGCAIILSAKWDAYNNQRFKVYLKTYTLKECTLSKYLQITAIEVLYLVFGQKQYEQ